MTDDLEQRVDRLEDIVDSLANSNGHLRDQLEDERQRRQDVEARLTAVENELDSLDELTDLLTDVRQNAADDQERRIAIILRTLYEDAASRPAGEPARAAMSAKEAWNNVSRAVHRTQSYDDLRRAADLVGDTDVCWYDEDGDPQQLVLDLDAGEPPAAVAGHAIRPGGVMSDD